MRLLLKKLFIKSFNGPPCDKFLLEFKSYSLLNNWNASIYDIIRMVQPVIFPALLLSSVLKNLKSKPNAHLQEIQPLVLTTLTLTLLIIACYGLTHSSMCMFCFEPL